MQGPCQLFQLYLLVHQRFLFRAEINQSLSQKNLSNKQQKKIDNAMDRINERYSKQVILPARILHEDDSPDVIAPSWRPDGFKRSV